MKKPPTKNQTLSSDAVSSEKVINLHYEWILNFIYLYIFMYLFLQVAEGFWKEETAIAALFPRLVWRIFHVWKESQEAPSRGSVNNFRRKELLVKAKCVGSGLCI